MNIGIIGAGSICEYHIGAYLNNKNCVVKAIADVNIENAKRRAEQFNIENVYDDYKKLLENDEIDAVSILTPTFTHKQIIVDALKKGKNVLCEKPPALSAKETKECCEVAKECGSFLMFGFVCRFRSQIQYLKEYIEKGKMGKIICGEAVRTHRCDCTGGWFLNKSKSGGGPLRDAAIHELDSVLYLMDYPEVNSVTGFTSDVSKELPSKVKGINEGWVSSDKTTYERDVENVASGYITFKNGASVYVKTSTVLHTVSQGEYIELSGEKAGFKFAPGCDIQMIETSEDNYLREVKPIIADSDIFQLEINHFVDCVLNGTECICKNEEAVMLMEIIDAIYKSAESGKTIYF